MNIDFEKSGGLVPAIVQDAISGRVLTLDHAGCAGSVFERLSITGGRTTGQNHGGGVYMNAGAYGGEIKDIISYCDIIDENKPLIKQIDIPKIKTYDDIINEYEMNEEECAVISASELERVKRDRMNELGVSDNRQIIEKYEEDQEKKAIISYEQLLKNAQNITLSYVEEEKKEEDAPRINKIEVTQKEVSEPENYLEQEQYLKILKEFRLSL